MSAQASILVGLIGETVWICVEGKGSFLNSSSVKEFAHEMINRGYRKFVVDERNCPVMDSTFMGTLAGIALKLRKLGQGEVHVVNCNERNHDLLSGLGLDQLFAKDLSGVETPAGESALSQLDGDPAAEDKRDRARTMLEAHEACIEANPANLAKFKDVLEYLKHDLHQEISK